MTRDAATVPGGAHDTTLPRLFAGWVRTYPDNPALSAKVDGVFQPCTFAELDMRAETLALAFTRVLGLRRGELVALVCNNRPEWMVCSLAIHFAGATDVPRGSDTPPDILDAILRHAEPTVAIFENAQQLEKARAALPAMRAAVLIDVPAGPPLAERLDPCPVHTLDDLLVRGAELREQAPDEIARRRLEVMPDDLATVIYTSGTTGAPKGVALTHANYLLNIREIPPLIGVDQKPVLTILQPWHAYERQVQLICLSLGCCLHYGSVLSLRGDLRTVRPIMVSTVPEVWVTVYKRVFQKIDAEKPWKRSLARWLVARALTSAAARRVLSGREPVLRRRRPLARGARSAWALVKAGALAPFHALADFAVFREVRAGLGGNMRFPVVGGGALPEAVDEFFDAAGMPLLEGYGMTEAIVVMALREPHHRVIKTTGHLLPGIEHRLVNEEGDGDAGVQGRLLVRGPNVMRGYYKDPQRTAEVLSEDGWLDTGDLARVHADGSLRVLGRLDDTVVLTSGKNVHAPYLENELRASEWIERAVVVGAGRPYVAAFVVPSRTHLEGLARSLGITSPEPAAIIADRRVVRHYLSLAARISGDAQRFASYERVQRVRLWLQDFHVGRELSQTLKLRRHEFSRLYAAEIDELYGE